MKMVASLVFFLQGADHQGSSVIGSNAIARTKKGQEAPREGSMGESENVGATISHIVEGDIMSLIIQKDSHPAWRDWQGEERVFIGACPVLISIPKPYHPESIVRGQVDLLLPVYILLTHSQTPFRTVSHLYLPVVPARREALAAQDNIVAVKSLWIVRYILFGVSIVHALPILRHNEVGISSIWIQAHVS